MGHKGCFAASAGGDSAGFDALSLAVLAVLVVLLALLVPLPPVAPPLLALPGGVSDPPGDGTS